MATTAKTANAPRGNPKADRPKSQTAFMFASLVGRTVTAHVRGGKIFSGLFHACTMEKDYSIALKFVQEIPSGPEEITGEILPCLLIPGRELVMLKAENVPINGVEAGDAEDGRGGFATDGAITKAAQKRAQKEHIASLEGRDLQMWEGADDTHGVDLNSLSLNESSNANDGEWDQFAVNDKMFGVKSTYREELYTTRLDFSKITKEQQKEADRIAREIEGDGGGQQEQEVQDGDEEALHSAVVGTGRYEHHGGRGKNKWDHHGKGGHHQFDLPQLNGRDGGQDDGGEGGGGQGTGALLAPWTKSINALNLESTMAVPRKDRKPLPSLAPKAMAVRVAQMPPPPKTPKVEKRNDSTPVSTLNPQAKAFQPGKAGVLHLAVSPGGSLSGTVKEGDHSHERGGFMGFGPGAMQEGPGGFHPQQRGNQRDSQKVKRSFSPKELLDDRTMHQVCSQLLDQVAKSGDQDKDTNWPEANGVAIHAIFGQPTITQDQLNQWLVRHANRASGQGGPAMGGPGGPQGQPGPPQQQQQQQYGQMYMAPVPNFQPQGGFPPGGGGGFPPQMGMPGQMGGPHEQEGGQPGMGYDQGGMLGQHPPMEGPGGMRPPMMGPGGPHGGPGGPGGPGPQQHPGGPPGPMGGPQQGGPPGPMGGPQQQPMGQHPGQQQQPGPPQGVGQQPQMGMMMGPQGMAMMPGGQPGMGMGMQMGMPPGMQPGPGGPGQQGGPQGGPGMQGGPGQPGMHMQGQGQPGMAQMQPGSQMSNLSPNPQNPQGQPGMPGGPQQGNPNMQGQQGMMQPGPGGQYMMMPAGQMGMQGMMPGQGMQGMNMQGQMGMQMQGQGMQQGQYAPVIFVNPNMPNMGGYQQGGQWMVDPNMQQQMQGMNGQGQQGGYPQWSQQGNPTPNQGNPS